MQCICFIGMNLCCRHLQPPTPTPQGLALIFILAGRGTPSPWTPSPPPPSAQVHLKTWVLGTFFSHGKNFRRLRRMPYTVYILLHVCSISLVIQTTMPQCSLSVYFSSPVPPLPRAKHEDPIDMLLYFRFKDRITGPKRQEAYNKAQKACATIFLSMPMATVRVCHCGQKMATRDRFRRV